MNRIEEELGLISDEQQKEIDILRARPDASEEEHLDELKRVAQIEILLGENLSMLNQQEQSFPIEFLQAISSTRNLVRRVIFDRLTTLSKIAQPYNQSSATNIKLCLDLYKENGFITRNLQPHQDLQTQAAQFIKSTYIDLQAVEYGRKYLGLK